MSHQNNGFVTIIYLFFNILRHLKKAFGNPILHFTKGPCSEGEYA